MLPGPPSPSVSLPSNPTTRRGLLSCRHHVSFCFLCSILASLLLTTYYPKSCVVEYFTPNGKCTVTTSGGTNIRLGTSTERLQRISTTGHYDLTTIGGIWLSAKAAFLVDRSDNHFTTGDLKKGSTPQTLVVVMHKQATVSIHLGATSLRR